MPLAGVHSSAPDLSYGYISCQPLCPPNYLLAVCCACRWQRRAQACDAATAACSGVCVHGGLSDAMHTGTHRWCTVALSVMAMFYALRHHRKPGEGDELKGCMLNFCSAEAHRAALTLSLQHDNAALRRPQCMLVATACICTAVHMPPV